MLCGNVVKERWQLHHKIGEGAFGEIYAARPVKVSDDGGGGGTSDDFAAYVAVKVEPFDFSRQVLKLEVSTLRKLQGSHFPPLLPSPFV